MKNTPLVALLCFLFVGPTSPDEEWTILLLDGSGYSGVLLVRLEGDSLVAIDGGDTCFISVADISEMFASSHPLGIPGWLIGYGAGGAAGAGCAAVMGGEASGKTEEGLKTVAILGCAAVGASAGALAGCVIFPEKQTRYDLAGSSLSAKKSMIISILSRHSIQDQ